MALKTNCGNVVVVMCVNKKNDFVMGTSIKIPLVKYRTEVGFSTLFMLIYPLLGQKISS